MSSFRFLSPGLFAVLAGSVVLASCVGDDPVTTTPAPDGVDGGSNVPDGAVPADANGGGDAATNGPVFTAAPARPRVARGASVDVEITIDRKGLAGDVTIAITGLPTGVTASAASIPAAGTKTQVKLTAAASAPMGAAPIAITALGVADLKTAVVVAGAPGEIDESFDGDGFVLDTAIAAGSFQAVLAQPDGKIVVAGTANTAGGAWVVKRLLPDGSPDTAFNTATAAAMPATGSARALALDGATGKIVVVGGSAATEQLTIVRLNPGGGADQGFASAGVMVADTVSHGQGSRGNAVVVLADSSVLVAGRNGTLGLVEAYSAKGLPHPTFLRYQTAVGAELFGLAALAGGSYLATGTDLDASPDAQLAVRLLTNGTPDAAFGGAAGRTYASGCRGYGLTVAANGDAVIVGDDQTAPSLCATRIAASGNGNFAWTMKTSAGSNGQFLAAATASVGDATYSAGHAGGSQDRYAIIERRLLDGGLDPAFGTAGEVRFEDVAGVPDTYRYVIRAARSAPDGRILVAGTRTGTVSPGAFVARLWE
ncbi:MAG TPA: delta-60 repeat domain-containing protein [Labilithrix sp.]|nr:delta-60 repeat domain-containing protein [Labilithrix sp.]